MYHYAGNNPIRFLDWTGLENEFSLLGIQAHSAIELYLTTKYGGNFEEKIPNAGKREDSDGRCDYINYELRDIYEIKPITQHLDDSGKNQLQNYVSNKKGYSKGTFLVSDIPDVSGIEGEILKNIPDGMGGTMDLRLITFPEDVSQAGMIYYEPIRKEKEHSEKKIPFAVPKTEKSKEVDLSGARNSIYMTGFLGLLLFAALTF